MNKPSTVSIVGVAAKLYSFDEVDKTTSVFATAVDDDLPVLNCYLKNENPVTELSARKVSTLSRHNKIVDALIQSQLTDLIVDDESRLVMAEGLEFSGINTLEQAESLNLRIIPPGPVFHTWYAKYQTGLFDGKNNPNHLKELNYVERVSEQADRLKQWGIPVILIYLERNMPPLELNKMRTLFSNHENILVMSLEHDLTSLRCTAYYTSCYHENLLDDPRYSLCREFSEVLSLSQKKAKSVGKTLLLYNLLELGGLSIIYSDIDNTFLRRPMFQLGVNGGRNICPFNRGFALQYDNRYKTYLNSPTTYETAKKHRDIFSYEGEMAKRNKRYSKDIQKIY